MKKCDITTAIYDKVFGIKENHAYVNKIVKAVIINFGDERGDIVVNNDNFGTRRKYADFTEGKKKAGLHPMQIVFSGIDCGSICGDRFVGPDDQIHSFSEIARND